MWLKLYNITRSDEALVEKARRLVATKRKLRWLMLTYAVLFLGMSGYFTYLGIKKIEAMDQLTLGFVNGLAIAAVWASFGVLGAICLGKFLTGFEKDFRSEELLVQYHDRLRELGQLPENQEKL
jgi:hypothetical protein